DGVFFAVQLCAGWGLRLCDQRQINGTSSGDRSCHDELDEVSAVGAHWGFPSSSSVVNSGWLSVRVLSRCQVMMAISEKTKMIVEIALISGVMPRRRRPQISRGRVFSRPMRKKLTAISSIESVKISSAAPMMDKRRFGSVTRQKVCQ